MFVSVVIFSCLAKPSTFSFIVRSCRFTVVPIEPFRIFGPFGLEKINQGFLQPLISFDQKPVQEHLAEELSVIRNNIQNEPLWSFLFSHLRQKLSQLNELAFMAMGIEGIHQQVPMG